MVGDNDNYTSVALDFPFCRRFLIWSILSRRICNPAWLPVADRAQPPAVRPTAQPYTADRPTPPATGKRQMAMDLQSAAIRRTASRNSPAPQNGSAGRSKACAPRRWNHSRYTSPPDRRSGYLQGTSGAQVNCTKGLDRCGSHCLLMKNT